MLNKAKDKAAPKKSNMIRSISRAVHVMQAINRHKSLSMTHISEIVGLPYPTACRIIETLIKEGVIERESDRKYYRATALAQSLSCGYTEQHQISAVARKYIVKLTKVTGWPVSMASRVGRMMVIQDSTHSITSMTFSDYYPGYALPINASASGLVYLAFTNDDEREQIISQIRSDHTKFGKDETIGELSDLRLEIIRKDGYASYIRNLHTKDPGKTSSISVPIFLNNQIISTMTLVFFSSALKVKDAIREYKKEIFNTQEEINSAISRIG